MWGKYISPPPKIWKHNQSQGCKFWLFHSIWVKAYICDWCMKMWILPDQENMRNTEDTFNCRSLAVCSADWTKGTVPSQTWQSGFPLCFSNITFSVCYNTYCNQKKEKNAEMPLHMQPFQRDAENHSAVLSFSCLAVWSLAPRKDSQGRLAPELRSADFFALTHGLGSHISSKLTNCLNFGVCQRYHW